MRTLAVVLSTVALFCGVEGFASGITVAQAALRQLASNAERVHTQYDPELGWVNLPGVFVPNLYGPGVSLRTNAQGFRNEQAVGPSIPNGHVRVVCSGDSFTLGYGVSNAQAWCNRLATIDPRIDAVNMGQGGYGADQAYLWYRRDGRKFDQDVQVFAFITDDFARMRRPIFLGYPKPLLTIDHEQLVVRNVPVPRRSELAVRLRAAAGQVTDLRTVQLAQSLLSRPRPATGGPTDDGGPADPERPVVARMFESLRDLHRERGSILVLVYLPMRQDYDTERSRNWRAFVREQAGRDGVPLVDLVDDLRTIAAADIARYFIAPGELAYGHADGHYTVLGNEFVAQTLYRRLLTIPDVASRFDARTYGGQ